MTSAPLDTAAGGGWTSSVKRVAGVLVGYVVCAGMVYLLETAGLYFGQRGLGIVGLAIDLLLLTGVVVHLGRRGSPLASMLGPLVVLLAVILLFAVADYGLRDLRGNFWSLQNLRTVAAQTTTIAVAALGMTLIIVAGGIDLSAGTTIALSATVFAVTLERGGSPAAAITLTLLAGLLAGMVNGILISSLRLIPFIVTLGTMSCYLGLAKILAGEATVRPPNDAIPAWLRPMVAPRPELEWLAWPLLPNFAFGVWIALGLALLTSVLLNYTIFGRHVFAVGSSEPTARLCGVNVAWTKIVVYALGGLMFAVAGLYQFARIKQGEPTAGVGMELRIIAAVTIGGGSLSGGRGSVIGTLTGAAIMQCIASGCTALGLLNPVQDIVIGVIVVAAVMLDRFREKRLAAL